MASFCTNCGAQLEEGSLFCTNCGTKMEDGGALTGEAAWGNTAANAGTVQGAATSSPTVTMPASEIQPAVPSPTPTDPSTMPMAAPMSQPVIYTTPPANATAAGGNKKTWLIVGIAAAAVIVVAAAVIAFMVLGSSDAKHRVTFETAGGTPVSSSEVAAGTQINEPAAPTRTDYKFDGWYLDSTYTSKVVFPYAVNEDTVLYAKWVEDKVSQNDTTNNSTSSSSSSSGNSTTSQTGTNTVTLTVVGADGTTRTAEIHRSGTSERVFPNSNTQRLTQAEVDAKSDAEKCIAWNEIIAASNGYSFKNSGLRSYFTGCSWYHANANASAGGSLSAEASANVQMLQNSADSWWMHLASN